jgi:hypothetical protein
LLVGLALYLAPYTWTFPQQVFRPFGHVTLTREQVAEHGAQVLRERGYKPETYHALISLSSNYTSTSYLLEHGSLAQLATLFGHEWSDTKWSIRYFRFNEKEEFRLQFDPAGKLVRWSHAIPREAPGASLEKAAALELATAYLVRERGFNPAQETLISDDLDQQEKRRDYHFIFKRQPWGWGEAELRTSIRVQGDEVVDFSRYVKIPEQWDRDRAKTGWKEALLGEGSKWTSFAIAAVMGGLLVFMIRRGLLPWRQAFLFALFPATLGLISWLNQLPWFFSGYGTTEPPNYFVLKKIGSFVFSSGSGYLGEVFRLAVALGLMRWTFGWNWTHLVRPPQERAARTRFFFDFIALLGFSLGVLVMQNSLLALINGFYFPDRTASFSVPDINNAVAFLDPLCDALRNGYSQVITLASTFALAVLIYRRFPRLLWVILLALPIARAAANDTPSEYLNALLTGEISWLLTLLLVWRFWRFHVSLIFVIYAFSPLLASIQTLLLKGGPYAWQALPLILVAAIPLAIACPSFKKSPLP